MAAAQWHRIQKVSVRRPPGSVTAAKHWLEEALQVNPCRLRGNVKRASSGEACRRKSCMQASA